MDLLDVSPMEAFMARAFFSTMLQQHMERHLDSRHAEDEDGEDASCWDDVSFKKGSPVRFCASIKRPRHGWQGATMDAVGKVQSRDEDGCVIVRYPNATVKVEASEIVVDEDCEKVQPGVTVRVKPNVSRPRFGWGHVDSSSVGLVREVYDNGKVEVDFVEASGGWKCLLTELEVIPDAEDERAQLGFPCEAKVGLYAFPIGSAVRVKPSVLEPRHDWGQVRPGCVGRVAGASKFSAQILVNFPEADHWRAHPEDIEIVPMANAIRPKCQVRLRKTDSHRYEMPNGVNHDTVAQVLQVTYDGQVVLRFTEFSRTHTFHLKEVELVDWVAADVVPIVAAKLPPASPAKFPDPAVLGILCPITLDVMENPCVAEDGETYDRCAILAYFKGLRSDGQPIRSPLTKELMGTNLIPNRAMRRLIDEVQQRKPQSQAKSSSPTNSKAGKDGGNKRKSGKRPAGTSSNEQRRPTKQTRRSQAGSSKRAQTRSSSSDVEAPSSHSTRTTRMQLRGSTSRKK